MIQKEWVVAPPAPISHLRQYDVNPILAQILYNRGFEDPNEAQEFLHTQDTRNEDPYAMKDMQKAVDRIVYAIKHHEPIVIYGDFDADGVTSTTLMVQVLTALNADVSYYIPDRIEEGYGLNTPALQTLARDGKKLVITVDCGIRSVNDVQAGMDAGLDIIVTDHHSIGPEIPPALAVINPQQSDCNGNPRLAGVGVAYMLAKALLLHRWHNDRANYPNIRESDLLDLVALGTVADIMALNSSLNRRLVIHGLNTINEMRRPGIEALAKVAKLQAGKITAMDIGFGLGPRINAAGRLKDAKIAVKMLLAPSLKDAMPYAECLQKLNKQRQDLTKEAQAIASQQIEDVENVNLIFASHSEFESGIVGLVAGRLTEEYYRPAIVLKRGEVESHASCRSIPEFDITQALDECADLLMRHGGHAMAAGFTIHNSNIDALRHALEQKVNERLAGKTLMQTLYIDVELTSQYLNKNFLNNLQILEPTGHGNKPASFIVRNLSVVECETVGKDKKHLKVKLSNKNGMPPIEGIGFNLGHWEKTMPQRIDAAFHLEINEWNGMSKLQMRLLDIRPAEHEVNA